MSDEILIEMHTHTQESSACSKRSAKNLIKELKSKNFGGVMITDHYMWDPPIATYSDRVKFLAGYYAARDAGNESGIIVLPAIEIRFRPTYDDFLVYGMDEHDILSLPDDICETNVARLHKLAKEKGWLVFQAHPFRMGVQLADPKLLDGIEIFNANRHQNNHNQLAQEYAKKHDFITVAGSDAHLDGEAGAVGIVAPSDVMEPKKFVHWLRNVRNPEIHFSGESDK